MAKLAQHNRITLFLSDFLRDEFVRNREGVIQKAITQFSETVVRLHRPNLVRPYAECSQLEQMHESFRRLIDSLRGKVTADAQRETTKADGVLKELLTSAQERLISDSIIQRGIRRGQLGQPPGKKESFGDAIHWEWLLETIPKGEDLSLVSGDGDFCSPLEECALSAYLADEWKRKKESNCTLFCSLTTFLKQHFPEIRLADEVGRVLAVERFEHSPNFATTHKTIEQLSQFDDFSKEEIARLITAFLFNAQIAWILGDADVKEFARKVVDLGMANGLESLTSQLAKALDDLEQ